MTASLRPRSTIRAAVQGDGMTTSLAPKSVTVLAIRP
jgi:hypothetical protein